MSISPFPAVFSTHLKKLLQLFFKLKICLQTPFSVERSRFCGLGKG